MNPVCGIYKITSPTGKIYIGQSVDVFRRKKCYESARCHMQCGIFNSIIKHGWDTHVFEVLTECDRESLNDMEGYYISKYNTFNSRMGLNLRAGGGSKGALSEESKKRISESKTGKKFVFSEEHKINLSISAKNRVYTKEGLEKLKHAKHVKPSAETKIKMSIASMGNKRALGKKRKDGIVHPTAIKLIQLDKNGNFIRLWDHSYRVQQELGFSPSNIRLVVRGIRKTANGFIWKSEI